MNNIFKIVLLCIEIFIINKEYTLQRNLISGADSKSNSVRRFAKFSGGDNTLHTIKQTLSLEL